MPRSYDTTEILLNIGQNRKKKLQLDNTVLFKRDPFFHELGIQGKLASKLYGLYYSHYSIIDVPLKYEGQPGSIV